MKKALFIVALLVGMLWSEKIVVITECSVRKGVKDNTRLAIASKGMEFDVLEVVGGWKKVKVLSGDHTGKIGYMYKTLIEKDGDGWKVGGQGTSLRSKPDTKSDRLANVGANNNIDIIETVPNWYKIKLNIFEGWIWAGAIKKIVE